MDMLEKTLILDKVTRYKTQEQYLTDENITLEEFGELLEFGDIQNLTLGTYNGATDEFTPCRLTTDELVRALGQYLSEIDWLNTLYMQHEDTDDLETFENMTTFDVLDDYLNCYNVFTIGNFIYADIR